MMKKLIFFMCQMAQKCSLSRTLKRYIFYSAFGFSNMSFIFPSHFSKVPYLNSFLTQFFCQNLGYNHFQLAPTFPIWLKCWLQQILSPGWYHWSIYLSRCRILIQSIHRQVKRVCLMCCESETVKAWYMSW